MTIEQIEQTIVGKVLKFTMVDDGIFMPERFECGCVDIDPYDEDYSEKCPYTLCCDVVGENMVTTQMKMNMTILSCSGQ